MSALTVARGALGAGLAAFFVLGSACTSSSEEPQTYCVVAKSSYRSCESITSCDQALAIECATLDKGLSPSTMKATQNCLESGVCGSAGCLTRAPKSADPTVAHAELAEAYCSTCAPDVASCTADFYSRKGRLPGALVLPYAEDVARAVKDACVLDGDTCRSTFTSCALDTIVAKLDTTLTPNVVDCVVASFQVDDEGGATGPGGGPQVTTCTSANCTGCCRNDKCEAGTNEVACGIDGNACERCSGEQLCKAGVCKEPCGPNNCPGCCDGDTCIRGDEVEKCGAKGEACAKCTDKGSSFVCSGQKCIDGSCKATCTSGCCTSAGCQPGNQASACGSAGQACVECGYGRACAGAKACELDRSSLWTFAVSSAVIPSRNKSGSSWDILGGAADPYLVGYSSLGNESHTGETTRKEDTHSPSWNEQVLKSVKASELLNNLSFEIWEYDATGDDFIGGCTIPLTPAAFTGYLQVRTCPATASTGEVKIYFRIQKP